MELSLPYVRRHFMVPMPVAESFDAMHARFLEQCVERRQAVLRAHSQSIGERMQADLCSATIWMRSARRSG
jgi:hypothetical protein